MSRARSIHHDQSGVALVFALLAVIILGGLAIVFVSRAYTQQRVTGIEQRYEATIHVAEAGVDNLISALNNDFELTTEAPDSSPHVYNPASSDADVERAWALDIAENRCTLVPTSVGEACAIRPELSSGQPADFVFGVGFVPNRADAQEIRVIKVGIALGSFVPERAILTDGNLNPFNITICGQHRDVHSNGSIVVEGGADTVSPGTKTDDCDETGSGLVTSVGSFTKGGNPDIDPASGQTGLPDPAPPISAREVYNRFLDPDPNNEFFNQEYADNWFNLCVNSIGQMEVQHPYDSTGALVAPCTTGVPVDNYDPATSPHFRGWRLVSATTGLGDTNGAFKCNPCFRAGGGSFPLQNGIYYAYEKNAYVSGKTPSDVQVTIISEGTGDITDPNARYASEPAPSGDTCTFDGRNNGNVGLEGVGGGGGQPFLENQLLLADRDVAMGGNFDSSVRGVIAAREQVGMSGQPQIVGALVTKDACATSANSPVSTNSVSGSFELDHTSNLISGLPTVVNITAWSEY